MVYDCYDDSNYLHLYINIEKLTMKHPKIGDKVFCKLSHREFKKGESYTIVRIEIKNELNGVWFKDIPLGFEYPFLYNEYFYSDKELRNEKLKNLEKWTI